MLPAASGKLALSATGVTEPACVYAVRNQAIIAGRIYERGTDYGELGLLPREDRAGHRYEGGIDHDTDRGDRESDRRSGVVKSIATQDTKMPMLMTL